MPESRAASHMHPAPLGSGDALPPPARGRRASCRAAPRPRLLGRAGLSQLRDAHPQSLAGACVRYVFPRGSRILFFLDRQDGGWQPAGGPFSRWAEDVLTDDAPWLQAVRFYIAVARLPEADRAAALTARRDELGALGDDPVAQLIAADIDRQLAGPNAPLREELPQPPEGTAAENVETAASDLRASPSPTSTGPRGGSGMTDEQISRALHGTVLPPA